MNSHIPLHAPLNIPLLQLEERLPDPDRGIIHGSSELGTGLELQRIELRSRQGQRALDRCGVGDVRGDADCAAAGLGDFVEGGLVAFFTAGQEDDGVGFCEALGDLESGFILC